MIGDAFVFDGVAHPFNFHPKNVLGDAGTLNGVDRTFASLGDAVRSGSTARVRGAINAANAALNALEHSAPETDPIEVAALRLVVLNADVLFPAA